MKNPVLFTFTLRDLIISFVMFIFMTALMIAQLTGWKHWLLQIILGIIMAAIMIVTDNKFKKSK